MCIRDRSQGHQTYSDNVDPKQDYNHAKFEKSCIAGFEENVNVKGFGCLFFSNEEVCKLSPLNTSDHQKKVIYS